MKRHIGFVMIVVGLSTVLMAPEAQARQGWYMDFYGGVASFTDPSTFEHDKPELKAESRTMSVYDLDFGYSFRVGLSLALGFELINWVAPNMRLQLKYSFLNNRPLQPYLYISYHGGLIHTWPMGGHIGGGMDYYVTKRFYIGADLRAGYMVDRIEPEYVGHIESVITVGIGFMFSGSGY